MDAMPKLYRRFIPQLLHMIILPVFFFSFMLIYRPLNVINITGTEYFGVHMTILSCVILICIIALRLLYFYLPLKLNYPLYSTWCLGEMIFISFFVALYLWLVLMKPFAYFEMLAYALKYISFTLVFPYVILALSIRIADYSYSRIEDADSAASRMRFYDEKHNLKIVLSASMILYIEADINYVHIYYSENSKVKSYMLRSSMKAIDELCQDHGLMRCHRSYYINPSHVKVLRKDREGIVYAELDAQDLRNIPVSKKYYDRLSELL